MASSLTNFPHFPPPPPPHITPPPPPPTPPDNNSTIIVIVFVSFGGLFFLTFLVIALCCCIKKVKKKKKMVQETDIIHVDERIKAKEAVVPGPHGAKAVMLVIEDEAHVEEDMRKKEFSEGMHVKSANRDISSALEEGTSTPSSSHHHLEHKP